MSLAPAPDPTRGPLLRTLLRLATPVVAMQLCHTAFHFVDVMWVGRLGAAATAAMTTAFFLVWTLFALIDVVGTAATATVARHIGAGERDQAAYGAAQAALLALVLAAAVTVAGWPSVRPIFALLGTAPEVLEQAVAYLRILLLGSVVTFLYVLGESLLRATGDTRTPLLVVAVCLALNAALDPFLIFGWGPFPRLGVAGAALATVFSQAVAVAWFAVLAARKHRNLPFDFAVLRRPAPRYMAALARIGAPFALIGILYSVVYLFLSGIAARSGTAALAVLGIGNRVESLTYLVAVGFGMACETMVGQNLGARQPARAERAVWLSVLVMAGFGVAVALVIGAAPVAFLRFFSPDAGVIAEGTTYLRVLALCQAFMALEIVTSGAFAGAGDTLPPMLISTSVSVLRIPLAFWASETLGMGLLGVAWTISLTCIVRAVILAAWFRRGAWKTKALATHAAQPIAAPDAAP